MQVRAQAVRRREVRAEAAGVGRERRERELRHGRTGRLSHCDSRQAAGGSNKAWLEPCRAFRSAMLAWEEGKGELQSGKAGSDGRDQNGISAQRKGVMRRTVL